MRGIGTIVNVVAVIAGSAAGLIIGGRLPERVRTTILNGIGLLVLGIGLQEFLGTRNAVFPLVSIVFGGVIGEALRIEDRIQAVGEKIRARAGGRAASTGTFADAFSTASLTFCVGPLTILGSLQDGLGAGAQLLLVKAALDGLISVIYAATLGVGVVASALTVAVVQGALTGVGAAAGHDLLNARMVTELTATGGVMIAGLGLRLLHVKEIRVGSYLPGLVLAPIAVALFAR